MRLPRPRFTIRRLKILVTVAGLLTGLGIEGERRRERFRRLAVTYSYGPQGTPSPIPGASYVPTRRRLLHLKYDWAWRHPWLPVWPDPSEPPESAWADPRHPRPEASHSQPK